MSATLSPLFSWRGAIIQSDLPANVRHVALTLSMHMSEAGDSCFPSMRTLSAECGRSPSTVTGALAALEVSEYLTVERGGGRGKPNRYTALLPSNVTEGETFSGEETLQGDPVNVTAVVTEDVLPRGRQEELNPSPAKPSKEERDSVWDALEAVFGKPTTPQHRSRFGRTRNELLADTSLTPAAVVAEIPRRVAAYRSKWPDMDLTLEAFAKHWPDLRANGSRPSANFPAAILSPELFREWRRTATRDDMVRYQHEFDVDDHGAPLEGF